MEMVFHQAIGMDDKACFLAGLGQRLKKIVPVSVRQENCFLAIPTAQHVIDDPFIFDSKLSRHQSIVMSTKAQRKAIWAKAIV
jgi:hypothetical protein